MTAEEAITTPIGGEVMVGRGNSVTLLAKLALYLGKEAQQNPGWWELDN